MALETNAFATYSAIGNREDLSDIIYDVSKADTPVLSAIPKTKATGVKHEWQKDVLDTASSTNFVLEGDAVTAVAATATTRVFNYCCISDKRPRVTGTQEAVSKAGRKSEMAYQMERKMKALKRDVEKIILENNAEVAGNATLKRECSGLQAWVKTNTSIAADATAATGDGTDAHTDGAPRALTETFVETVLASAWTNGGMPSLGVMNAFQKRKFAGFSGNSTRFDKAEDRKVTNSVDVYIDPLGNEIRLVPCRQAPTDVVYFIDPEYLKFATLRDFQAHDIARTGDSMAKQILVEYTLEVCNEAAHAGIYDLTAS